MNDDNFLSLKMCTLNRTILVSAPSLLEFLEEAKHPIALRQVKSLLHNYQSYRQNIEVEEGFKIVKD